MAAQRPARIRSGRAVAVSSPLSAGSHNFLHQSCSQIVGVSRRICSWVSDDSDRYCTYCIRITACFSGTCSVSKLYCILCFAHALSYLSLHRRYQSHLTPPRQVFYNMCLFLCYSYVIYIIPLDCAYPQSLVGCILLMTRVEYPPTTFKRNTGFFIS